MRNRFILLYLTICLVIGGISLYLSYGVFTSCAWFCRFGYYPLRIWVSDLPNVGGWVEFIRLFLLSIVFYLVFRVVFRDQLQTLWDESKLFVWKKLDKSERFWALLVVVAGSIFVLLYHIWIGPQQLRSDFLEYYDISSVGNGFLQFVLPYLFYSPYSIVMYLGLGIPMLIGVFHAARHNKREYLTEDEARLSDALGRNESEIKDLNAHAILVKGSLSLYVNRVAGFASQYFQLASVAFAFLVFEFYFNLYDTLATVPQEAMKYAVWVFLIIAPLWVFRLWIRYNSSRASAHNKILQLQETAIRNKSTTEVESINKTLQEFNQEFTAKKLWSKVVSALGVLVILGMLLVGSVRRFLRDKQIAEIKQSIRMLVPYPVCIPPHFLLELATLKNGEAIEGSIFSIHYLRPGKEYPSNSHLCNKDFRWQQECPQCKDSE